MPLADTLTDVANLALASIGEVQVENINDDSTPSKAIRRVFSESIRQVQLIHDWPELRVTFKPSLDAVEADTGLHHFNLPTNFLDVIAVKSSQFLMDSDNWELSGKKLVTPSDQITLTYKRYTEEPTDWSGYMVELIYKRLAMNVAMQLTQNQNIAGMATQEYERAKMIVLTKVKNRSRGKHTRKKQYGNLRARRAY